MNDWPDRQRLGVDIGGTFTDLAWITADGRILIDKVLTTPEQPAQGVTNVMDRVFGRHEAAGSVRQFVHGTTLVTNALIERKGGPIALLATAGFRDALEMRREHRYELYDLMVELPPPLVPRHLRFDVPERILADGTVDQSLDVDFVRRLTIELWNAGIKAVAICFLHSFAHPQHERAARETIFGAAPDMRVGLSSEIIPDIREFERMSTVAANVYVQERAGEYLDDLRNRSGRIGIEPEPLIMMSSGGTATVEVAREHPIRMVESGPAGGALAAAHYGRILGLKRLLAFDMGGTTAKLCAIDEGTPLITHRFEVDRIYRMKPGSGLPLNVPVIDMIEIGVGGGSIARLDSLGLVAVGPDSAGADPGPACYGRGGILPTVTDADLVLGYLDPLRFLGGDLRIDLEAAERAIRLHVADPMGVDVVTAAWAIHRTANEGMANAARVHAVERGFDVRSTPLFAYGGAGPVHGVGLAAAVGSPTVIIPPRAGVISAIGFLTAPLMFDHVHVSRRRTDQIDSGQVGKLLDALRNSGAELLTKSGVAPRDVRHEATAEMRYVGQGHNVHVPIPDALEELRRAFETRYAQLYGRRGPDLPVEVMTWRVVSKGRRPELALPWSARGESEESRARGVFFAEEERFLETPVFSRTALGEGWVAPGPVIIEERESTVVVPPGWSPRVGDAGCLVVDRGGVE